MNVNCRALGADDHDVAVIVVYRSAPWQVTTVLYRREQVVEVHARWNELPIVGFGPDELDEAWKYLLGRIADGSGGNGITYELEGFGVANVGDIEPAVLERDFVIEAVEAAASSKLAAPAVDSDYTETNKNGSDFSDAELSPAEALYGGDPAWNAHVPWLYRSIASPGSVSGMLSIPVRGDNHMIASAYWTPLLHLLLYSFGWSDPARGLRWWYQNGKPTGDRRFELVARMWDRDGELDWFAAWLWSNDWFGSAPSRAVTDREWILQQYELAESSGIANPLVGGSDPLHLSMHCGGPSEPRFSGAVMLRSGRAERRAVLVLDSMIGWYAALGDRADGLPGIGDRSWRVDVVVKPVGWLGTYRRSRLTGRWFVGPHRLHVVGSAAE